MRKWIFVPVFIIGVLVGLTAVVEGQETFVLADKPGALGHYVVTANHHPTFPPMLDPEVPAGTNVTIGVQDGGQFFLRINGKDGPGSDTGFFEVQGSFSFSALVAGKVTMDFGRTGEFHRAEVVVAEQEPFILAEKQGALGNYIVTADQPPTFPPTQDPRIPVNTIVNVSVLDGGQFFLRIYGMDGPGSDTGFFTVQETFSFSAYVAGTVTMDFGRTGEFHRTTVFVMPAPSDLSMSMTGSGTGTVMFSPGYYCSGTCRQEYDSGVTVTLNAVAALDSIFGGWTGCDAAIDTTCTVSMTSGRSISANFTRLSTGTGTVYGRVIDSSGAGVANALVRVIREYNTVSCSGPSCMNAITDSFGNYLIGNIVPGPHITAFYNQPVPFGTSGGLVFTTNQWYNQKHSMASADLVTVNEGSAIQLDAVYPPFGQISGTVNDTNGTGMANVAVRVADLDEQSTDAGWTDAAGNYTVRHLPTGTYKLRFIASSVVGPFPAQNLVSQVAYATVTAPGSITGINATMNPGKRISGRITNRDGLPVAAYAIVLTPNGTSIASAPTNTTGAYTAMGIPPGSYKVLFRANPPFTPSSTIDVTQLYARRFYGGSAGLDSATVVTVPADADVSNIDGVLEATGPAIVPSDRNVINLVAFMKDFGVEVVGMSSYRSFMLTNSGTADLTLGALSKTGDDFSIINDRCSGVTLAPTKICTFQVAFIPLSEGAKTGSVAMSSNDPDVPLLNISLAGSGGAAAGNSGTTAVPYGDNVTASPTADVNLSFTSVTSAEGTVTATAITTLESPLPSNFRMLNGASYDITTTASFSGPVTVCIVYDPATMANPANEQNLRLFHYNGTEWQDITASVNTVSHTICGETSSLSPFVVAELNYVFTGFFSPVDNPDIVNNAKAGQAIPFKWRLTDAVGMPISDPASFTSLTSYIISCNDLSGDPESAVEEYSAGNSGLQYLGDGYWQFNWKTPKSYASQCRRMILTLGDGSIHEAYFKFK